MTRDELRAFVARALDCNPDHLFIGTERVGPYGECWNAYVKAPHGKLDMSVSHAIRDEAWSRLVGFASKALS